MKNINDLELLELVESFIQNEYDMTGFFKSEEALSEAFDCYIEEMGIVDELREDDPALSETFSNWSDSLCKDGRLHSEQYSKYCYVGELA